MIVLAALLLFLMFKVSIRAAAALRKHLRGSNRAPVKRRTSADVAVDDAGQQIRAWTSLDDLQLNRLLKDAARH